MNAIILLIIGGAIITGGDLLLKKWATNSQLWVLLAGLFISVIGLVFLAFGFKSKSIATANIIFIAVNMITLLLAQIFYFKETLTSIQFFGILLSVVGLFIIELGA